jgi:hypothetical protein
LTAACELSLAVGVAAYPIGPSKAWELIGARIYALLEGSFPLVKSNHAPARHAAVATASHQERPSRNTDVKAGERIASLAPRAARTERRARHTSVVPGTRTSCQAHERIVGLGGATDCGLEDATANLIEPSSRRDGTAATGPLALAR